MLTMMFLAVFVGGIILTGCENKGNVIAVVNGDKIYEDELNNMLVGLYGSKKDVTDAEKQSIYESLINSKLVEQECIKRKIDISQKEIDKYLQEVIKANGVTSKTEFYKQLKDTYGYTKDFVDNLVKSTMEEKALYDAVIAEKVKEDDSVLKKAYDANPVKFKMVEVSHILVSISQTQTKDAAKTKAKALIARLSTGADFATLAKENSDDTGSAVNGGLLSGYFGADNTTYVADFVAAAVKLKLNEFTREPVLTEFGYHIIKATGVKYTYDEVKDYVKEVVYGPIKEKTYSDFISALAKKSKIERKLKFNVENTTNTSKTS